MKALQFIGGFLLGVVLGVLLGLPLRTAALIAAIGSGFAVWRSNLKRD